MDSSTDSFEEIEESMQELVQRAEAFLSAFPSTSASSSSSGSSSSSVSSNSRNNSTRAGDDSFSTAADSSLSSINTTHESSLTDSSAGSDGSQSELSAISGTSSSSSHRTHYPINPTALFSGDTTSASDSPSLFGISGNSTFNSLDLLDSSSSTVSSLQRNLSEDCILVPGTPVPVVDLCSSWVVYPRNLLRQIANSAPVVDSITLDDTVNEPEQGAAPVPSAIHSPEELPQPSAVVNEYRDGPPAKRSKEGAVLDLSQSTDGGADKEPAIALTCPICFDSIFTKRAASTICGHLFCHDCISQEIKVRKQCPLCKRKLARSHVHPIYCP